MDNTQLILELEQMRELLKKSLRVFSTSYVNAAQMETLHEIAALIKQKGASDG